MKGDYGSMKIALAVWKNRISPVFDVTRVVIIVTIKDGIVNDKCHVYLQAQMPHSRAVELVELGVHVLVCGAISSVYEDTIKMQGIKVIPFIAGKVNQVIESYLKGKLNSRNFKMPGCGNMYRKRFRGKIKTLNRNIIIERSKLCQQEIEPDRKDRAQ